MLAMGFFSCSVVMVGSEGVFSESQNFKLIVCLSSQNEWMAEKKTGKCQFQNLLPTPSPIAL
jgi:hypothetical protein